MARIYPDIANIGRLKVSPTPGEWALIKYLDEHLNDSYEVFFNPYLDGDRPDLIILKEGCAAFIIEVKDWDLIHYSVSDLNRWEIKSGGKSAKKSSPHSQAYRYKKNLYDLHLPVVGIKRLTNPNFFNLVFCYVYFHEVDRGAIAHLYRGAEDSVSAKIDDLNEGYRKKAMCFSSYERKRDYLSRVKKSLQRDKSISFGNDRLRDLVKKIRQQSTHNLFDDEVYHDFKRRLSPPDHMMKQGIPIEFDATQKPLTISKDVKVKIKGVAGCGKTAILAQRAVNAYKRHGSTVLILTYNITLKNFIRDKISDVQGGRDFNHFEITNYHQFFNSQANNIAENIKEFIDSNGLERVYRTNIFASKEMPKYRTILIDEIQDYDPEWVKIVRDSFLAPEGEMVLFGDDSQNIYDRDGVRSPVITQGFGRWIKITRSYRTGSDSRLNSLFRGFQLKFLVQKYKDAEVIGAYSEQFGMRFELLKYEPILLEGWVEQVFSSIQRHIREFQLHPNDIVVLCSKIDHVRQLNEFWAGHEKTHCMFETFEELASCTFLKTDYLKALDSRSLSELVSENKEDVERIRRAKKNHFYANSGLIKLSTIHSFKGLESKTVFYIMLEGDTPEVVYTSITRSAENLVVFDLGSRNPSTPFLRDHLAS